MKKALEAAGAQTKIIASHLGYIAAENGKQIIVDQSFLIATSVLFDAVLIIFVKQFILNRMYE
jgi:catalase